MSENVFEINGIGYVAVETTGDNASCHMCDIRDNQNIACTMTPTCIKSERKDGKEVYFKMIAPHSAESPKHTNPQT